MTANTMQKDKECTEIKKKDRETEEERKERERGVERQSQDEYSIYCAEHYSTPFIPSATWSGNKMTPADSPFFNSSLFPLLSSVLSRLTLIQFQPCWGHSLHGYVYRFFLRYSHTLALTFAPLWYAQQLLCNCISGVHFGHSCLRTGRAGWVIKVHPLILKVKCV